MTTKMHLYFSSEKDPIAIHRIGKQNEMGLHGHEFHELVIVLKGSGIHFTEDEEYAISAGDVFLVTPGHAHGYRDTNMLDLVNILFLPDRINIPVMDMPSIPGYHAFFELEPKMRRQHNFKSRLNLDPEELEKAEKLVGLITKELKSDTPGRRYLSCAYFMELQCFIARNYSAIKSPEGKAVISIADVITYMGKNYRQVVALDKLAKIANMSKSTLHRNFLQATGLSPVKYLIKVRIMKAADLLRNGTGNVTETAFTVGFNDSNYFVRQFRKIMGITPKKYREKAT